VETSVRHATSGGRETACHEPAQQPPRWDSTKSIRLGVLAAGGMAVLYTIVVIGASGSVDHYLDQVATDWYLLLPIVIGFGVQVGLLAELRGRGKARGAAAAVGGAGAGASTVGMVACCAHHLADLAPFVGATAAATVLYDYRLAFMLTGLGFNAIGITLATRRLRRLVPVSSEEVQSECVAR